MSETPVAQTPMARLETALNDFVEAIGASLEDICSYGLTMGDQYVPFNPDEDEDCDETDVSCSQAWVRVESINPKPGGEEGFGGVECGLTLQMVLEVGVLRCIEIPEDGEAPTTSDVLTYSIQNLEDMNAILCAALSTEVWDAIDVGSWVPTGPLGGQYGGIWNFTVEI